MTLYRITSGSMEPTLPVGATIKASLNETLKDTYSVQELAYSNAAEGGLWTGTLYQGLVPSWYSCVQYNAKNSYGGYVGLTKFVYFIRDDKVVQYFSENNDNGFHKHGCF